MSFFISRVEPIFKDWQFRGISEGIELGEWLNVVSIIDNLNQLDNAERFNLISVQNPEYYIHLWRTEEYGSAIIFSSFPDRYKGEIIKYLYEICKYLDANLYSLGDDGQSADKFDFSIYDDEINKEYFPINERKVTDIEVTEMMGIMCLPTIEIAKVISNLRMSPGEITDWENAVQKCYDPSNYMVRTLKGWTIIIGQLEHLIVKFKENLNIEKSEKDQFIDLLKLVSAKFEKVSYTFNASRYSYFENFIAENGELVYKYVHGDGEEYIEGQPQKNYFDDFMSFCYDESILDGIQLYR